MARLTCRRTLRMPADRGGPEVAGRPSKRRDDPKRTFDLKNLSWTRSVKPGRCSSMSSRVFERSTNPNSTSKQGGVHEQGRAEESITPAKSHFARNPKPANVTNRNETRLNRLIETKPAGPPLSVRYGSNRTAMANSVQLARNRDQPKTIRVMNNNVNQLACPHGFQSLSIIRGAAQALAPQSILSLASFLDGKPSGLPQKQTEFRKRSRGRS